MLTRCALIKSSRNTKLIIGDPRGDNLMVGSISRKLLTELGIRTEDAECKLMGDKCNFVIFVLIIKSCVGKYQPKTSNQHTRY